jgi:hypothetical protein
MNRIIFFLCSLLFLRASALQAPKLCINCKHFIPDSGNGKYGKCAIFPIKEGKIDFLVNGINENRFHYCSTAREYNQMCGEEGTLYKKKKERKPKQPPQTPGKDLGRDLGHNVIS